MLRGDMDEVGELAAEESIKEQASKTYLALRQVVRAVHRVTYRLDAEDPAPDDAHVTLSVSHAMTIDAIGTLSSFGTLNCEGKYAAAMTETATGWKVSSFTVESSATRPEEASHGLGASRLRRQVAVRRQRMDELCGLLERKGAGLDHRRGSRLRLVRPSPAWSAIHVFCAGA